MWSYKVSIWLMVTFVRLEAGACICCIVRLEGWKPAFVADLSLFPTSFSRRDDQTIPGLEMECTFPKMFRSCISMSEKKMPCWESTCNRGTCLNILAGLHDKSSLFLKGKLSPASMSRLSLFSDILRCFGSEKSCSYLLYSLQHSPAISIFQKSYTDTPSWWADVLSSGSWKAKYTYLPDVPPQNVVAWNKSCFTFS